MNKAPWLPTVRRLVAVASGKGGVGKTTVTVNLALALQRAGWRVGIFDADIYGPNIPLLLGIHQRRPSEAYVPVVRRKGAPAYIRPLERHGLKLMSVGLLLSEEQVINPPASTVGQLVIQTMRDVVWGELDALLIDLPPSAGQPQEDLLKAARLDGAVIVTTPQDMSLLDAGRSLQMFKQAGVPILGIVENMSYFICPSCGERHEIFRGSGRRRPPALEGIPVIGRVPLAAEVASGEWGVASEEWRVRSEEKPQMTNGHTTMTAAAERETGRVFDEVAAVLIEKL
jgi:ATP-binding protein involved in chromosome partitioning